MTINIILIMLSVTVLITIVAVALAFIYIYSLRRQMIALSTDIDFVRTKQKIESISKTVERD